MHSKELIAFDAVQRETFTCYTSWTPTDPQWNQATRGYKHAGLGIRSTARHAAPAYLASYTATLKHCAEIDTSYQWEGNDPESGIGKCLLAYNSTVAEGDRMPTQAMPEAPRQQKLSFAVDKPTTRNTSSRIRYRERHNSSKQPLQKN